MSNPRKDYTNHRGERAWRHILPLSIAFDNNQWHPESQWIMEAVDCDKNAIRDFSLASIHEWRTHRTHCRKATPRHRDDLKSNAKRGIL